MKQTFPEDFKQLPHRIVPGASQWIFPKEGEAVISVIGSGSGLYGDGVTTFEMYDFREDDVQGHLTKEDINEHLKAYPVLQEDPRDQPEEVTGED